MSLDPNMVVGAANPVANGAMIAMHSLMHPSKTTVIVPPRDLSDIKREETGQTDSEIVPKKPEGPWKPGTVVLGTTYNWILVAFFLITVVSGVAHVVLAAVWGDEPNEMQQDAVSAIRSTFQSGVGAFLGLIGGKSMTN